jgi:tripartite-type tricarboxylate transporter receptor subunit TctC
MLARREDGMISRRKVSQGLAAAVLAPFASHVGAQGAYPGSLTIKLVVPYPPGGATDVIGRIVAERLAALWRTTVIVENVSGAAANIGMDRVAKGAADGTQILVVPPQIAINQFLYARLAYDPEKDLLPVAQVAGLPNILVIRKSLEPATTAELIAYARANPGKLNYASAGNGTTSHLCAELLKRMTGIALNHIPYRGSAPAANDVVAGQVDLMFDNATSIIGQVRGGAVKALGVTSLERSPLLPDLPAIAETVAGYDATSWFGIGVRSGTPDEVVAAIEQGVRAVMQEPAVKERLATLIADPVISDRRSFGEFVAAERRKWGAIITELKIRIE